MAAIKQMKTNNVFPGHRPTAPAEMVAMVGTGGSGKDAHARVSSDASKRRPSYGERFGLTGASGKTRPV